MKAYGGFIAAQRRHLLVFSKTSIMAITFAAENNEDAIQMAARLASKVYTKKQGWYNQHSVVTSFEDATLNRVVQQLAAEFFDEWVKLEKAATTTPQETADANSV